MGQLEKGLYPAVETWAKRHFGCFKTGVNRGPRHGRIDIVGVRDTGGDLTGDVDVIGIEVKRGTTAFANMCGQTVGYAVYANRVYLADSRKDAFTPDQIQIAGHLGIGLIHIRGKKCVEVLSSRYHQPIPKMRALLLEKIQLGTCQWCSSVFELGRDEGNSWSNLVRQGGTLNKIQRAVNKDMGLMFWNTEVANRKRRLGLRETDRDQSYERRYICPDCIQNITADLTPE